MAKITENKLIFMQAAMDTPFDKVCVKRRSKTLQELCDIGGTAHGILVRPVIPKAICQGRDQGQAAALLAAAVEQINLPVVTVRGHGWGMPNDKFVWTGTVKEFNKTWEID